MFKPSLINWYSMYSVMFILNHILDIWNYMYRVHVHVYIHVRIHNCTIVICPLPSLPVIIHVPVRVSSGGRRLLTSNSTRSDSRLFSRDTFVSVLRRRVRSIFGKEAGPARAQHANAVCFTRRLRVLVMRWLTASETRASLTEAFSASW